jgi:hypothetical protein
MEILVLTVPNCPNAPLAEQRLARALEGRTRAMVKRLLIEDMAEAERYGMRGSPTLLINGDDPFSDPSEPTSVSCKFSPAGKGQRGEVPTVEAIIDALDRAARAG